MTTEQATAPLTASFVISKREATILSLAGNGLSDKQIAQRLDINLCTVRTYWERVRTKLPAANRTHAVSLALAMGWIEVDVTELMMKHARSAATLM